MGMAGAFFSIFLNSRFDKSDIEPEKKILIISFSICYAFSQYNIAQSSNIMWIDGVYMLPLILLGVYNVANNRKMWKLIIPVAFSILFNWYTAAINCLFSLLWIIMELVLTEQNDVRTKARAFVQYIFSIIIALMCSAVLFLPTVNVMKNSSRGDLQFGLLRDFSFKGDVLSIIQSYTYGARSTGEKVSLYCGVLALVIFLEFFFTDKNRKRKLAFTFIAAVNLLMFYWNPLYSVFSLLKNVASYWCRFSYLGIATLLFIAFYYLSEISSKEYTDIYRGGVKYALILLILNYARRDENRKFVYYTAILIILVSFVLKKYILSTENKKYILVLLSVITIFDVTYNSYLLMKNYHTSDVNEYKEYVQEHEGMIRQIKNADNNIYRISQTFTRNMKTNNLTANYNEAINYGFWSISGYTSSPDEIQLKLLHKLGYRQNGLNMCIVNTSVLGADSFLGVKYILSDYPVNGLKPVSGSDKIYFNPYYLPLAFTYIDNQDEIESDINPFEFQNRIYSKLLGEKVEIYKKLDYEVVQEGDLSQNRESKYKIFLKEGENAVYGNIPWNSEMNAVLNVNGYYETDYSKWLSPSVFYIPVSDDDLEAELIIKANSSYDVKKDEEQFYALDLKLLEEISNRIRKNEANKLYVENGKIEAEVNGEAGANLILTVPYDKNWKIRLMVKELLQIYLLVAFILYH